MDKSERIERKSEKQIQFPKLIVQADPMWKGKHPYHDSRFITTDHPLVVELKEMPSGPAREDVVFDTDDMDAKIIASMRDTENQKGYAALFASAPELLEAAKKMDALMDNLWKTVSWGHTCGVDFSLLNDAPGKLKAAILKAQGGAK